MAIFMVNRALLHILVVILTCYRLQQVDAGPSLASKHDLTKTKAINFTNPISKESINLIKTVGNRNDNKRGWEAIELNRRKRDFIEDDWAQREGNSELTKLAKFNQDTVGTIETDSSKSGWTPLISEKKRGWDGIDFPWKKRTENDVKPKQNLNDVNVAFRKLTKALRQKWRIADISMKKTSFESKQVQNRERERAEVLRKRGWDGVEFHFNTNKYPNGKGWIGGAYNTGKRSGNQEESKIGWTKNDFAPDNHSDDIESHKRGGDGVDFTSGRHSVNIQSQNNGLHTVDVPNRNSDDIESHKRGWDGVEFNFGRRSVDVESHKNGLGTVDFSEGKRSNENETHKRGWDGIEFPFGKRTDDSYSKQDWAGMDVIFGVGMDTNRAKREKRGWEGLNLHYRVINAFGPSQGSDYRKRGWEGVDTCVCCHSSHRVMCCLACNRNNPQPQPRITTKSYKDMFYVRDTVCKCCYAAKAKDCCDLCEIMS